MKQLEEMYKLKEQSINNNDFFFIFVQTISNTYNHISTDFLWAFNYAEITIAF